MKYITTILCLLLTATSFAQLTVKPVNSTGIFTDDNYVYVDGTVLFVKQETNLTKNNDTSIASLYLRNEAQLIQGGTGFGSFNDGDGVLSLFQEGTSDNFEYNYWSSPVGTANPTQNGNLQFGAGTLGVPIDKLTSGAITGSSGYDGTAIPFTIAKYWINTFINTGLSDYAQWNRIKFLPIINAGEGFTMKGTSGLDNTTVNGVENKSRDSQRYDFRGRPHDGEIELDALRPGEIALIGNPYPSAIDLNYFLLENSGSGDVNTNCTGGATVPRKNATTGIAYFWDMDGDVDSHNITDYSGGYGAYAVNNGCAGIGTYAPPTFYRYNGNGMIINSGTPQQAGDDQYRRFLPIGQGFFVNAPTTVDATSPPDIQFSNRHRVFVKEGAANESYFDRPASESSVAINENLVITSNVLPTLRLNVAFDDLYTRQVALAFNDDASSAVEPGMDALNFDSISSDAGFLHEGNSYIIDTRPFDIDDRLPLYLNLSSQTNLSFKVNNFENFDTENVYIYDKQTEEYHSVKDNYFYIALPAGNYSERFELTFKDSEEDLEVSEEIASSFEVFQNNTNAQLNISNPLQVELSSIEVFDMTGKRILSNVNLGIQSHYTYSTSRFAEGVYVVRVLTKDNISTTQKISIFKGR